MQQGSIYRQSDLLIPLVWHATNMLDRMRGLLGRKALKQGEAMLIEPCSSVHTLGMAYPLDIAFLDTAGRIVKLVDLVKPYRLAAAPGARATLELAHGEISRLGLSRGDVLNWTIK